MSIHRMPACIGFSCSSVNITIEMDCLIDFMNTSLSFRRFSLMDDRKYWGVIIWKIFISIRLFQSVSHLAGRRRNGIAKPTVRTMGYDFGHTTYSPTSLQNVSGGRNTVLPSTSHSLRMNLFQLDNTKLQKRKKIPPNYRKYKQADPNTIEHNTRN